MLASWLVAGATAIYNTDKQAHQLDEMMGEVENRRLEQRRGSGRLAIQALLDARPAGLEPYDIDLFLPTPDSPVRIQAWASTKERLDEVTWTPPAGAAGYAFQTGKHVVARGAKARDDTYLLTPEEQQRFANLEVVSAMPVKNAADRVVAVLTAYGDADDGGYLSEAGREELLGLAQTVVSILIHVMAMANDL